MANTRKIFVCSAGFGEGHNTAARNLVEALNLVGAGRVEAEFIDTLGVHSPRLYALLRKGYIQMMNRAPKLWSGVYRLLDSPTAGSGVNPVVNLLAAERNALAERLEREKPAAVVSTYPYYGYALDEIARRGGPKDFLKVTVVTDSISINSIWYRCASDFFCVPNEPTAAAMRAGVCRRKNCACWASRSPRSTRSRACPNVPTRPDPRASGCST